MYKIALTFDLYRLYDRAYDGVLISFDGHADLEDILKNNLIFNKNFTIDNFHFEKYPKEYIQRIRADENKIIKDTKDFLNQANIAELFFETIAELGGTNPTLDEFDKKYMNKFYPD